MQFLDKVEVEMRTCEEPRPPNGPSPIAITAGQRWAFMHYPTPLGSFVQEAFHCSRWCHVCSSEYGFAEKVVEGMSVRINSITIKVQARAFHASFELWQLQGNSLNPKWQRSDLRYTRVTDPKRGEVGQSSSNAAILAYPMFEYKLISPMCVILVFLTENTLWCFFPIRCWHLKKSTGRVFGLRPTPSRVTIRTSVARRSASSPTRVASALLWNAEYDCIFDNLFTVLPQTIRLHECIHYSSHCVLSRSKTVTCLRPNSSSSWTTSCGFWQTRSSRPSSVMPNLWVKPWKSRPSSGRAELLNPFRL